MSVNKPRTIDNLGIDSSIRYAKDMELLDTKLVQDSQIVGSKNETSSLIRAHVPSEYEYLFQVGTPTLWAAFSPPPNISGKNLFTFQLIPSLGGSEKTEEDADRLDQLKDALQKPFKQGNQEEQEQEEKERKILLNLLHCIEKLDKTLIFINARRNQYQRG